MSLNASQSIAAEKGEHLKTGAPGQEPPPPFLEWIVPLTGVEPMGSNRKNNGTVQTEISVKPSSICQSAGAASEIEQDTQEAGADAQVSGDRGSGSDHRSDKESNYEMLASIMAACTPREKPKVYLNCESAGLPLRELDRLAQALHDSAIAGRPKISLGVVLPELGEIRFDVQIAGKVVFVHAFVENERAASALALAVSALRERLEQHQLVLGKLDVTSPGPRLTRAGRCR